MSEQATPAKPKNVQVVMWHPTNSDLANKISARVLDAADLPAPGISGREELIRGRYCKMMGIKNLGGGYELRISETDEAPWKPPEKEETDVIAEFRLRMERMKTDPLVQSIVQGLRQAQPAGVLSIDQLVIAVAAGVRAALTQEALAQEAPAPKSAEPEAPRSDPSQGPTMSRKQR
jgi:hypothetical protein